jgi:hypothetical protein
LRGHDLHQLSTGGSADVTGRIYDRLIARFGRDNVFKEVDSILAGVDFRTHPHAAR